MPTAHIRLAQGLPEAFAPELEKRLFFISSAIDGFELIVRDGVVEAMDLAVSAPDASSAASPEWLHSLEEKIHRVVESEILVRKILPPKVLWQSRASAGGFADVFPALVENGTAFEAGEGQVAFGEPLISLMDCFDRRLRAIALDFAGAKEYRYPTLLPVGVLERFGYFSSFPQFVMFVTRLHNDIDVYNAFIDEYETAGKITPGLFAHCHDHGYCLPPTMCYHTYHQYRGRRIEQDTVVTAKGKSFRFEAKYRSGLRRLWDFTIREIVFMGTPGFALASRQAFMERSCDLIDELGLSGTCEVATDLFFGKGDTVGKVFSQRMREAKYELLLDVGQGSPVAVASFNFHDRFFGKAFEIAEATAEPVTTGCVGFGLERLVYAFLCQHGLDPARWPAVVRREIG
jgi:seryl-tRNA synthetase